MEHLLVFASRLCVTFPVEKTVENSRNKQVPVYSDPIETISILGIRVPHCIGHFGMDYGRDECFFSTVVLEGF